MSLRIERKKVSVQVYDHIKKMIQDGKFRPGDKLPAETKLSEMFGVSRTPVREAMSILEASGLIKSVQGGGSVVQSTSITNLIEMATLEMVALNEVLHLLEVRVILEGEAAALAALRRTDNDLARVRAALLDVRRTAENEETIGHEQDIRLHEAIVDAAHNPVLKKMMDGISGLYYKAVKFSLMKNVGLDQKRQQVLKEHDAIVEAIARQDAVGAKEAMTAHLQNAKEKLAHYQA